ncbi:DUF917 domain-containing protein [Cohnella thermotolerans]|uniref:DUF917 domain-containing protein n=1 Tax=Cohnella thermotolerans TaxID=329858 RepID=UPI0003FFDCE1|nr:DUF917 domain-containing protein [Cohnella thermotolerans]
MRRLTYQEAEDIIYGACICGTGGGGSATEALDVVRRIYDEGKSIRLAALEEIGDDWTVASPYYMGSILPPPEHLMKRFEGKKPLPVPVARLALEALQAYLGEPIRAVIATELGGNTSCAMEAAAALDIPLVDADPAGRSVPELEHTTFRLHGIDIYPLALASRFGDTLIVTNAVDHSHADMIGRAFAGQFGNLCGVCDHPVKGGKLRGSVIGGTLTMAEKLGRARRIACETGRGPAAAIAEAGGGKLLAEGTIVEAYWNDAAGFTEGSLEIEAAEDRARWSIGYRNEHMVARRNGEIASVIPELIVLLDRHTGMPILNPDGEPGMEVAIVTLPAPAAWETEEGLAAFGPEYIGLPRETYWELKEARPFKK